MFDIGFLTAEFETIQHFNYKVKNCIFQNPATFLGQHSFHVREWSMEK